MSHSRDEPLANLPAIDIDRYMGDWYVQGHIPLWPERNAHNAVESYCRDPDDSKKILTAYAFRDDGFDAPLKTMTPTGMVEGEHGAEWSMRFLWPFKAEYLIAYVDADYSEVIVARSRRDYVWLMTRDREVSDSRYASLLARLPAMGYDAHEVRHVPQRWPDPGHPANDDDRSLAESTYGSPKS